MFTYAHQGVIRMKRIEWFEWRFSAKINFLSLQSSFAAENLIKIAIICSREFKFKVHQQCTALCHRKLDHKTPNAAPPLNASFDDSTHQESRN